MTETLEPIAVPSEPSAHDDNCPFCAMREEEEEGKESKIGEHNDATKLGSNLRKAGSDVNFEHADYGRYSAEPHHLVSGKEALQGHPIETWLSAKVTGSEVNADSGFDINSELNGIWLPSVTDANRVCNWDTIELPNGKKKRRASATDLQKRTDRRMWSQLSDEEKDEIAFAIMGQEELQFHKGNHRNKGATLAQCYIKEVGRILDEIKAYTDKAVQFCEEATPDEDGLLPSPHGVNDLIYRYACGHMRWHVSGSPESWFVFISALSSRFYEDAIAQGAIPWPPPFPGHPSR